MSDAAAAGGTTAASSLAPTTKWVSRFNHKPHVGEINGNISCLRCQILGNAEGKSIHIKRIIFGSRLVQSQRKTRPLSASGGKIYPNGSLFPFRKKRFQLLPSCFTQINHRIPPVWFYAACSFEEQDCEGRGPNTCSSGCPKRLDPNGPP